MKNSNQTQPTRWAIKLANKLASAAIVLLLGTLGPSLTSLDQTAQAATSASSSMRQLEAHANKLSGQTVNNVDIFLEELLAPANSDHEKAWLIYSWATRHFRHDAKVAAKLGDPSQHQLERLIKLRRGSCAVYAYVTTQLLQKAGLEAQSVAGQALVGKEQTQSGTARHVWTQVRLNQQWWTMDSTWGAGYINDAGFVAEPNPDFFLIDSEQSVLMYHDPQDRFGFQQQLGIGLEQFRRLSSNTLTLINLGFNRQQVLQTAKHGTPLADTFDQASGTFTVQNAPLVRHLRANKAVEFLLASNHYQELAVVQNQQWQTLRANQSPQGVQYSLRTTPKRGELWLMGRKAGSQEYEALLAYQVQ